MVPSYVKVFQSKRFRDECTPQSLSNRSNLPGHNDLDTDACSPNDGTPNHDLQRPPLRRS